MEGLVDAVAAGASDVDIAYALSRREAKNAGHGSVGEESYINSINQERRVMMPQLHREAGSHGSQSCVRSSTNIRISGLNGFEAQPTPLLDARDWEKPVKR